MRWAINLCVKVHFKIKNYKFHSTTTKHARINSLKQAAQLTNLPLSEKKKKKKEGILLLEIRSILSKWVTASINYWCDDSSNEAINNGKHPLPLLFVL